MHDELDGDIRETKIMEERTKKIPIDVVKSFLQVKLESDITLLPFRSSHEVDDFVQNN